MEKLIDGTPTTNDIKLYGRKNAIWMTRRSNIITDCAIGRLAILPKYVNRLLNENRLLRAKVRVLLARLGNDHD